MQPAANESASYEDIHSATLAFYRNVLKTLNDAGLPYLIGGGYAFHLYTGINRLTKDFDLFIARVDYDRFSRVLSAAGYGVELTYPHWLAKVQFNGNVIDLVFGSGNGIAEVDKAWFDHAVPGDLFGVPTKICPAEEMLWSKAFIMERERFDGADIAHLMLARSQQLDWPRLLRRFDPHWRLLLSHLTLFGMIYPAHRDMVPRWIMDELLGRLKKELDTPASDHKICGGTLLSREQYLEDIQQRGYQDARLAPLGNMTRQEAQSWTEAIKKKDN